MSQASPLLESLAQSLATLPARDAAGLGASRRGALEAVMSQGLPSTRSEAWKYTSLRGLERRRFAATAADAIDTAAVQALALPDGPRLVFVNGVVDLPRSRLDALPEGVELRPLSAALADGDARGVNFMQRRYERSDEAFARLNAALAVEGAVLRVAAEVDVGVPLHLVFIGCPAGEDRAWHLRHLIELRDGAKLQLVEHHLHAGEHAHLSNALVHVHVKRGAELLHARIQAEAPRASSLLRTDAVLAADSRYRRIDLELGAGLSRHELNVALQGRGAQVVANGVLLATGRRHLDTRLGLDHAAPATSCELNWRGIAGGRGRGVFHGGILIREGADGSKAMLANKNLLLSEGAEIDTQPVLVIHADEVEAAHGATVGQIDPGALFYLRSRGLSEVEARQMLTTAFCREPLAVVSDEALAEMLRDQVDRHLAAMGAA